jgi:hypothetical protein
MGLLDEAIREHLDLKRRRGADPTDIERAEREALGPVRRGPEETEAAEPQLDEGLVYDDDQPAGYEEEPSAPYDDHDGAYEDQRAAPYDDQQGRDWGEALDTEHDPRGHARNDDPFAEEDEPGFAPNRGRDEPEARGVIEDQPTQHMSLDFDDEDPFEEPHAATTPPPQHPAEADDSRARGAHPSGGETVEYDVESAAAGKGGKKDEDVLEETPEFLQDTPDHDRLWFEQKPPRDFDFDG